MPLPSQQLKPVGADPDHPDTLQIPDDLGWMFDFERALEVGMAFRFDLTAAQARARASGGLLVAGRPADRHRRRRDADADPAARAPSVQPQGLELLRQGTPTNDTEKGGAGYSWREDPDASFGPFFKQQPQYAARVRPARAARRAAGSPTRPRTCPTRCATRIPGADRTDRADARAMQIALWPATIGYFMDTLLAPVSRDATVAATREFFTRYVSGRGPLPALRIGVPAVRHPAGRRVLAGSAGSTTIARRGDLPRQEHRLADPHRRRRLAGALAAGQPASAGPATIPTRTLLDVLGLHPASVEYYPLHADSLAHKSTSCRSSAGTLVVS